MTAEEISLRVVTILNDREIPYMLVGSLSTNFHSVVRSTKDADIVIQPSLSETGHLIANECSELQLDPQFGFESVTGTQKLVLRSQVGEGFIVELFGLSDDPHDQERFRRRLHVDWFGQPVWIASAEDGLITKLRWSQGIGREKDIADARNLIVSKGATLDWKYIEHWCGQHGTLEILNKLRQQVKSIDA
jgi:hypothetical protein